MLAETIINITGMRPGIPTKWVCDSAEHTLDKTNGWQARLKLKKATG
jgi:phage protein D